MRRSTKEGSVCTFEIKDEEHPLMEARRNAKRCAAAVVLLAAVLLTGGCVTVRPEQRAILADPVMQFQGDPREAAQRQHVLENREGSFGGSSVQGGGCGCN
jgi:hypothetical protein